MLSLNDIINIGFRKSGFSGYRADDVDSFVDSVRESYEELLKRCETAEAEVVKLKEENRQNIEKLKVLANKIEEYRNQEDEIKNALISAQKLSEASVREARHKAEIILKDAELKAERVVADADRKIVEQKKEFERMQKTVSDFRSKLLGIYKEHLTLIDALPGFKPETAAPQQPAPAQKAPEEHAEKEAAPVGEEPKAGEEADTETESQPVVMNFDD
jgi:cell division initiation protein